MKEIEEIARVKKKFSLSTEEFLKGDWLKEVNKMFNYDKFDMIYNSSDDNSSGELVVKFYKKTEV